MSEKKETYKGQSINDMEKGDVIYISKMESGYQIIYECKFIEYKKGVVYAEPIGCEPDWAWSEFNKIDVITTRKSKCFLWGLPGNKLGDKEYPICHWFK